ncbi:MAG TPA: LysR substrate-binding domain-containing protein, partial [Dongiaceae bacterium]
FVQAVEAGSFTLAAVRLGVSKSAVGKSIARLEQRLGVKLLNRTTRQLRLTAEGESFYQSCLRALSELEEAQALLASRRRVPSGRVRIDIPVSFGRVCVAPVLLDLSRRYPELSLEITFTDRRVDLLEEGVDIVVRMGRLEDSTGLVARRLYTQRSAICAAPSYLKAEGRPRTLDDLEHYACINYGRENYLATWQGMDESGSVRSFAPRGRLVLGHGEAILDAVLQGHGLTFLPTWLIAEHLRQGSLELVFPDVIDNLAVHALWPKARDLAPKIRVVVDELVRHFAPTPAWDRL